MNREQQRSEQRAIRGFREVFERSVAPPPPARRRHGQPDDDHRGGDEATDPSARSDAAGSPAGETTLDEATLDGLGFAPAPRGSRSARLVSERRPAIMLAVVAVIAALVAALITWLGRPVNTPVGPAPAATLISGDERDDPSSTATTTSSPQAAESIPSSTDLPLVVAVVGRVVTPGLVTLPPGSRVADAIAAAGGPLPDTDLTTVNLARKVSDGEQIVVGLPGPPAEGTSGHQSGSAGPSGPPAKININQADAAALDELPGIGPVLAGRIVTHRETNGPFASVDELGDVSGIGPALLANVRDLVTV